MVPGCLVGHLAAATLPLAALPCVRTGLALVWLAASPLQGEQTGNSAYRACERSTQLVSCWTWHVFVHCFGLVVNGGIHSAFANVGHRQRLPRLV